MSCWEVAAMVVHDGARWTVRHDEPAEGVPEGWNLWRYLFSAGLRGEAELVQAFGEDRAGAVAAARMQC